LDRYNKTRGVDSQAEMTVMGLYNCWDWGLQILFQNVSRTRELSYLLLDSRIQDVHDICRPIRIFDQEILKWPVDIKRWGMQNLWVEQLSLSSERLGFWQLLLSFWAKESCRALHTGVPKHWSFYVEAATTSTTKVPSLLFPLYYLGSAASSAVPLRPTLPLLPNITKKSYIFQSNNKYSQQLLESVFWIIVVLCTVQGLTKSQIPEKCTHLGG
jgi:hypothetical protein